MSTSDSTASSPDPSMSGTTPFHEALQHMVPYLAHPATTHIAVFLISIIIQYLTTHVHSNCTLPTRYLSAFLRPTPSAPTPRAPNPPQHPQTPRISKGQVPVDKCIERLIRALPEDSIVTIDTPAYRKVIGWDLDITSPKADEICVTREVYEKMIRGEELEEKAVDREDETGREGSFVVDYVKVLGSQGKAWKGKVE